MSDGAAAPMDAGRPAQEAVTQANPTTEATTAGAAVATAVKLETQAGPDGTNADATLRGLAAGTTDATAVDGTEAPLSPGTVQPSEGGAEVQAANAGTAIPLAELDPEAAAEQAAKIITGETEADPKAETTDNVDAEKSTEQGEAEARQQERLAAMKLGAWAEKNGLTAEQQQTVFDAAAKDPTILEMIDTTKSSNEILVDLLTTGKDAAAEIKQIEEESAAPTQEDAASSETTSGGGSGAENNAGANSPAEKPADNTSPEKAAANEKMERVSKLRELLKVIAVLMLVLAGGTAAGSIQAVSGATGSK